ncbi:uncharacterized protein [Chelonus insularis]|uniref:uncharacterized protein isoform X2 n=1 Tax=Chelonus insularis TaxID=460826 RepID=UPI001589248E|nr:uncharacterized protein LOC118066573 isoform X2 [Chelonus insularis]
MDSDTKESESDDEVYDFVIIEFIKRGRKTKKKGVHVIPSSWLNYDAKKKHYTCPFPPEPYENLDDIVKRKSPPHKSWNIYNVKIKGHDDNYKQAKKKAQKLQSKDNAFSTDTDFNSTEKTVQLEQAVKTKILKENLVAMKKYMDTSNNNEHSSNMDKNSSSEQTSSHGGSDISEAESSSSQESSKKNKTKKSNIKKKSVYQKPLNNACDIMTENIESSTPASCSEKQTESGQQFFDPAVSIDAYIDNNGAIVVSDINRRSVSNQENNLKSATGFSEDQFIQLMEKLTCLEVESKAQTT